MMESVLTRCGLGDPGIESWWGRDFSCVQTSSLLCSGYRVCPGVMGAGLGPGHQAPSSAGVQMVWNYTSATRLGLRNHDMG
jgi:hypothetical protein